MADAYPKITGQLEEIEGIVFDVDGMTRKARQTFDEAAASSTCVAAGMSMLSIDDAWKAAVREVVKEAVVTALRQQANEPVLVEIRELRAMFEAFIAAALSGTKRVVLTPTKLSIASEIGLAVDAADADKTTEHQPSER